MRKIAFWLSLLMIFVVPWEDSISLDTIGSVTRLLGFVVAGVWLLTILIEGRFRKPHLFHLVVLLFLMWNALTFLWSLDTDRTMERIKTYAQIFLLMFMLWDLYQEPKQLLAGMQAYILGAYVTIGSAIINYLNGTIAVNYEERFSATGINAVDLALILLLGLPIAWHLLVRADRLKSPLLRAVNIAYLPLSIFTTLLTGSRTSLFAIVPAVIYILWPKKAGLGRFIAAFTVLILAIVLFRAILPSSVIERLSTVVSSFQSADLSGRVTLWRETITMFAQHPIIGNGSGTLYSNVGIGSDSHNTFLSVLAETGSIGLVIFVSVLAVVFSQAFHLPKAYAGVWLATVSVWVIGVLSLSWEFRKPTWIFLNFVIIEGGLIHKQMQEQRVKTDLPEDLQPSPQTSEAHI
jgi:O-antigen ligase